MPDSVEEVGFRVLAIAMGRRRDGGDERRHLKPPGSVSLPGPAWRACEGSGRLGSAVGAIASPSDTVPRQMFCGNLVAHHPATGAARSDMTAAVSDETDDEGRGVPGMKQSHEFRTREASNPNDWLRNETGCA
jgi:hypothetical protein